MLARHFGKGRIAHLVEGELNETGEDAGDTRRRRAIEQIRHLARKVHLSVQRVGRPFEEARNQ